jgi:hypothetical protein
MRGAYASQGRRGGICSLDEDKKMGIRPMNLKIDGKWRTEPLAARDMGVFGE